MLVLQLQNIAQLCSSYATRYQNDSGNTPFKQSIIRLFRSKILILETTNVCVYSALYVSQKYLLSKT